MKYAGAIADPGGTDLACVPSQYPNMTRTDLIWAYADITSPNTITDFWVVGDPISALFNTRNCIVAPGTGYVPFTPGLIDLTGPVITYQTGVSNSNFAASAVNNTASSVSYRVVGAVLQIRYVGTALNMGGTFSAVSELNHNTLNGTSNAGILNKFNSASLPITQDWISIQYRPNFATDYQLSEDFLGTNQTLGPGYSAANHYYMGAWITPALASQPFQVRLVLQGEFAGTTVRDARPTESDPDALSATAQTATKLRPTHQPLRESLNSFMAATEGTMAKMKGIVYNNLDYFVDAGFQLANMVANTPGNDVSYAIANATFT